METPDILKKLLEFLENQSEENKTIFQVVLKSTRRLHYCVKALTKAQKSFGKNTNKSEKCKEEI
jgi:hypothetical protein